MSSVISYSNLKLFVNLRIERPFLYLKQKEEMLILTVTSRQETWFPHKFKLEERCSCLDSEEYAYSFVNLNTKILVPWDKWDFIVKKYGINLTKENNHNCLTNGQRKELEIALKKYWMGRRRKLITIVLNN